MNLLELAKINLTSVKLTQNIYESSKLTQIIVHTFKSVEINLNRFKIRPKIT